MLPFNQQTLSPMRIMTRRSRPNSTQSRGGGNYYPHRGQQLHMRRTVRVGGIPPSTVATSLSNTDNNNQIYPDAYHGQQRQSLPLLVNNNSRGGRRGRGRGNLRSRGAKRFVGQARTTHSSSGQPQQQLVIDNSDDMAVPASSVANGVVVPAVLPRRYPMRRSRNSVSNMHDDNGNRTLPAPAEIDGRISGFQNNFPSMASSRSLSPLKLPLLPTPDTSSSEVLTIGVAQAAETTRDFTHSLRHPQTGRRRRSPRGKGALRAQQPVTRANVTSGVQEQQSQQQHVSSTQAEPQKVPESPEQQQQAVVGGGPMRTGRHRYRKGNNNYPYQKPVGFAHKIRKPYHELTWEEKKKIAAAEERKAELRQQRYEEFGKRKSAPHNTTQYIIDQSEADAMEFPKKSSKKHSNAVTESGDAAQEEPSLADGVASGGEADGGSDDEYDYDKSLEREFDEQYDKVQQSRLGKMSKAELVEHCTSLESEREYLIGKLARLEIDFQSVRAENERMKKEQLELQAGSIVTRRGGVGGGGFVLPSIPQQAQISSSVQHDSIGRQDSLYGSDDAHSSSEMSGSNLMLVIADSNGAAAQPRGGANQANGGEAHDGIFVQPSMHRMQTRNAQARTEQQQHHIMDHFGPSSSGGSSAGGKGGGGRDGSTGADDDNTI